MNKIRGIISTLGTALCFHAAAGPNSIELGKCLTDNTNGKERKDLARWLFIAMGTHPEIKQLSAATGADLDAASKSTGALFTRLLTENCAAQMRSATETDGKDAIQAAFATLGQVAMQELMSDKDVNAAFSGFERYVDKKKVEAVLGTK
jgi:hypothetical protein